MPISEVIIKEIENDDTINETEKSLIKSLLAIEDNGSAHYTDDYKKLLDDYIKQGGDNV